MSRPLAHGALLALLVIVALVGLGHRESPPPWYEEACSLSVTC